MIQLATMKTFFTYGDWADQRLLECAAPMSDEQLDKPMEIGPGTLRRTLLHTYNGEHVWLQRWKQVAETKWPSEAEKVTVAALGERFRASWKERDAFLATLNDAALAREQPYRDSKGSLFHATLGDMLAQAHVHSTHHRAQAVNILRRLGGEAPELDYMMHIRRPA